MEEMRYFHIIQMLQKNGDIFDILTGNSIKMGAESKVFSFLSQLVALHTDLVLPCLSPPLQYHLH